MRLTNTQLLNHFLASGHETFVVIKPGVPGVHLPGPLMDQEIVHLAFNAEGTNYRDLVSDEEGFRMDMPFDGGVPHLVLIPWNAVAAMINHGSRLLLDAAFAADEEPEPAPPKKRGHLTLVKG